MLVSWEKSGVGGFISIPLMEKRGLWWWVCCSSLFKQTMKKKKKKKKNRRKKEEKKKKLTKVESLTQWKCGCVVVQSHVDLCCGLGDDVSLKTR